MNNKNNPLLFTKEDIYGENMVLTPQIVEEFSEDYIDVFEYENITMEYCFKTGETSLYLKNADNQYELLYESAINDGIQNCSLYSRDSVFILNGYNTKTNNIQSLDFIPKDVFIKFIKTFGDNKKNFLHGKLSDLLSLAYMAKYFVRLIGENNYYSMPAYKNFFDNYKKTYIKYTSLTNIMPVYNIISEFIDDVHSYIATGQFDQDTFKRRHIELHNFKEFCPGSIAAISSFIKNPQSTDLQKLCDYLGKNLKNMEHLINLYLEDELKFKDEGERNDCK